MNDLFRQLFSFPTGIFSVLLALVACYWLLVIAGALDLDLFEVPEGADTDGFHDGFFDALLNPLGLKGIPLTIPLSLLILFGWVVSLVGNNFSGWFIALKLTGIAFGCALLLVALIVGVLGAALTLRPFRSVFAVHQAEENSSLVGKICTVTTQRVDERFGQAEIPGTSLVVQVRCPQPNDLRRGSQALIFEYDPAAEAFSVNPVSDSI
ncbi:MAG: hypothetical protein K1Y36_20205 [Blastocatellia bacterium]|nr:hypothetical protein [Blastocatellia bacterium]